MTTELILTYVMIKIVKFVTATKMGNVRTVVYIQRILEAVLVNLAMHARLTIPMVLALHARITALPVR